MTAFALHREIWAALGTALVHLVWQGGLVALLVAALQPWLETRSAACRYGIACAGLFALPVMFAATLARLATGHGMGGGAALTAPAWLPALAPYIALAWAAGLVGFGAYAAAGWMLAGRIRQRARLAVPEDWQARLAQLRSRMAVRARVGLRVSAEITGPCVLGWWRPTVLLPASLITGLPIEHCEALLAHELAHIRRHDYLVNLMQRWVEVVFFYHPAVWWLSHRVSEERELCCDDAAVAVCGNRAGYAGALVELARQRRPLTAPQGALAAGGGSLRRRVARLLGHPAGRRGGSVMLAVGALLLGLTLAGLSLGTQPLLAPPTPAPSTAAAPAPVAPARYIAFQTTPAPSPSTHRPVPPPAAATPPAALPRAQFVGFTLEQVQRCVPRLTLETLTLPSGQQIVQVRTMAACVPVVQPMEVWVMSSM
jgi:beta-lactamase regulating signal transducer with metallopeptidase domain